MITTLSHPQRIARLTPLAELTALIAREVAPVAARRVALSAAAGGTLAEPVIAASNRPARALALRDGWALRAEDTVDAGSYAPALLAAAPVAIEAGAPLPDLTDAVAPLDAVRPGSAAEALLALTPGDGVLEAGADAAAGETLMPAGRRLRPADLAALHALAVAEVNIRMPRVLIVAGRPGPDAVIDAGIGWLKTVAAASATVASAAGGDVEAMLAAPHVDAVLVVGGTGTGAHDKSVTALGRVGRVAVHGVGLNPGDSAAFGFVGAMPVLVMPGRLDAVIAVWLAFGRHLLARLSGGETDDAATPATLARKIVSALGCVDLVPVRCDGAAVTPLASGYWPLAALAAADGYIAVPADSEGYPAGSVVEMRAWV